MHKVLLTLLIIVVTLSLLTVGAAYTLESRWFSGYLSDKLSSRFGRNITWDNSLSIDWSLHPDIAVENVQVGNAVWAPNDKMVRIEKAAVQIGIPQLLSGTLAIEDLRLIQPVVHLATSTEEGVNWAPFISKEKKKEPLLQPAFGDIRIDSGRVTFKALSEETDLTVAVNTETSERSERTLLLNGSGVFRGHPVDLQLTGDPPRRLAAEVIKSPEAKASDDPPYALQGQLRWQEHALRVQGGVDAPTSLSGLNLDFRLQGPNADELAGLLGFSTRSASYGVQGQLVHQDQRWSLKDVSGRLGESDFSGHGSYAAGGPRPRVEAAVQWTQLDVDGTLPMLFKQKPKDATRQQALLTEKQLMRWLQPLREWEASLDLRIGKATVRDLALQELVADVQLNNSVLELQPIRFGTPEGYVRLTGTVDAAAPSAELNLELGAVDAGRLLAPFGYENLGTLDGEATLLLRNQALLLGESDLTYKEPGDQLLVKANVQTQEVEPAALGMQVSLSGKVKGKNLEGSLRSGPILDLASPDVSYPLDANLQLDQTQLAAEGTITQPWALKDLVLNIRASGPDPAFLGDIAGVDIPHLSSYQIQGHLVRENESWYLRNIDAEMGDTDLSGDLRWDVTRPERPTLWANLHSQYLDVSDFTSGNGDRQPQKSPDEALPEASIPKEPLQAFDARIEYVGRRVQAGPLPLDEFSLDLRLEDGVLKLNPVNFGIGRGSVVVDLGLDVNETPADGRAEIEVNGVNLKQVLQPLEIANQSKGIIGGQGELWFSGDSVDQVLASLDGELRLIMSNGTMDAVLVEAAGLDLGEVLITLFGEEPEPVDVRCAYTAMQADDGLVEVKPLLIATEDSNLVGQGDVNLRKETFEILIESHPKDFSLFTMSSPIRVYGSFANPQVDVFSPELLSQSLLTVLGAAVFPPAALLGLAEAGDAGPSMGCRGLVASR